MLDIKGTQEAAKKHPATTNPATLVMLATGRLLHVEEELANLTILGTPAEDYNRTKKELTAKQAKVVADLVIRIAQYCNHCNIDMERAIASTLWEMDNKDDAE